MIAFASVLASEDKFTRCALPGLQRVVEPDSPVAQVTDARSMCSAYNEVLDAFAGADDLEALVLLHEDTELRDPDFCDRVRRVLAEQPDAAVVGVVGARGARSLAWWEGRTFGRVEETRGTLDFGAGRHAVDVVDGLLMVLSPWAVRTLRFDEASFDAFHGYDADLCAQARAAGRTVLVEDLDVFHHTKGGLGDEAAYARADAAWQAKWAPDTSSSADCPVCGTRATALATQARPAVVACAGCGTGLRVPAPERDVTSDAIWVEQYGGGRLAMREHWLAEAAVRVDWVGRHVAPGRLLDVGCATGELAVVAAQAGHTVAGVEPSAWAAGQARAFGVACVLEDVAAWREAFAGERADAITLFHVLEHVPAPAAFLRGLREALAEGGTLFVEVPNFAAEDAQRDPVAWAGTALDDHVVHHTPDGLRRLLEASGFAVAEVTPMPSMVYDGEAAWAAKCRTWRELGMVRPSEDLLRVRAVAV